MGWRIVLNCLMQSIGAHCELEKGITGSITAFKHRIRSYVIVLHDGTCNHSCRYRISRNMDKGDFAAHIKR